MAEKREKINGYVRRHREKKRREQEEIEILYLENEKHIKRLEKMAERLSRQLRTEQWER